MFVKKCLLTLLLAVFCQNWGLKPIGTNCHYGALAGNATETLVVTVSAEPGVGQDILRDLIKASQNATLRPTDSKGQPLRAMDDEDKGSPPLGPRRRQHKTQASPRADPPEPGKRCPREHPTPKPEKPIDASMPPSSSSASSLVAVADKTCTAHCSDQDGVEEAVDMCDEGCEDAAKAKTEAEALKGFDAVVEGGTETAVNAAKDGEAIKKAEEACRPCKKNDKCEGIQKVEGPVVEGEETSGESKCPPGENDPCNLVEGKKGSDACRPAEEKDKTPVLEPVAEEPVAVKEPEEPQCRISLEEEGQVNADCRSCSARVLPGGGVKLSCFQCEHRPADQTCYFARKMDPIFKVSARFFEMAELTGKKNGTSLQVRDN